MKLINISGPMSKFDVTAMAILRQECFQPENVRNVLPGFRKLLPFEDENPYKDILKKILDLARFAGVEPKFISEKLDESFDVMSCKIDMLYSRIQQYDANIAELKKKIDDDNLILYQMDYLAGLNVDIRDIYALKYFKYRFGKISKAVFRRMEYLTTSRNENPPFIFIETGSEENYIWGAYFAPSRSIEYVDTLFASMQFERIRINERALGTPGEVKENVVAELKEHKEKYDSIIKERETFTDEIIKYINVVYSDVVVLNKAEELKKTSGHSQDNFYMSGWVAKEDFIRFVKAIDAIGDIKYIEENPSLLKTIVPTKMRNLALFRPFESFIRMYGVPGYGEIDPTPLVAISYLLFFGIMFGDLGQGAVIVLIGAFLWFSRKVSFGKILMSCGAASMVFGTIYDTVFGYEGSINRLIFGKEEIEVGFSPSRDMMQTLIIAVSIGVALIVVAMLLNIYNGLKQRNYEKALFSQNGVAGFVFYSAAIYLVINLLLLGGGPVSKAYMIGFFAVPLVVIFFRGPLGNLISGRKKSHESIGEFLIENFFELFDDLLSFITNTVSFVRIGAFALSHAGMMFVVFLLAKTTVTASPGSGNLLVVIIGNILIMGLEGLVVGIQGLRLEFYEIFSRFYSGDGTDFKPVKVEETK
jgi:V/A-type H+-transporting ATPase subunit I